jgi:hypothetical protein
MINPSNKGMMEYLVKEDTSLNVKKANVFDEFEKNNINVKFKSIRKNEEQLRFLKNQAININWSNRSMTELIKFEKINEDMI